MKAAAVEFHQLSRHFGDIHAVDNVDLRIEAGEFFAMLGPSGSGKTTCLRLVAGFEQPTRGSVSILGQAMANVPPYERQVNTVFQDYALFPHLNVVDNIGYGLMIRGVGKAARRKAAEASLEMVRLPGYADRKTTELSGGQRQRVALARALVNKPKVLLLDEPLGALDLKLREQMQEELKELQRSLAITFVFVTHDQGEALSMADRVAVFNEGRIVQVGSPQAIYHKPDSEFVANFVGSSNVLPATFVHKLTGTARAASLRPEAIRIVEQGGQLARIISSSFLGSSIRYVMQLEDVRLTVLADPAMNPHATDELVRIDWNASQLHVMQNTADD